MQNPKIDDSYMFVTNTTVPLAIAVELKGFEFGDPSPVPDSTGFESKLLAISLGLIGVYTKNDRTKKEALIDLWTQWGMPCTEADFPDDSECPKKLQNPQ